MPPHSVVAGVLEAGLEAQSEVSGPESISSGGQGGPYAFISDAFSLSAAGTDSAIYATN